MSKPPPTPAATALPLDSIRPRERVRMGASLISRLAMADVITACERDTGLAIEVQWETNPVLKQVVEAGAHFDLVAIEPDMAIDLAQQGLVARTPMSLIGKAGMALLAKSGAPPMDVRDLETFKSVLLGARAISYSADGFSGGVFFRTLDALGLMEALRPKLAPVENSQDGNLGIVNNAAEYYAGPISMATDGMQAVASFPDEVQTYIGITAAVGRRPVRPRATAAVFDYLLGPVAQGIFKARGFVGAAGR